MEDNLWGSVGKPNPPTLPVTPRNSAAFLGSRELGTFSKNPRPPKELQWAAEESLIDSRRVYTESVCSLPDTTRSTFLMVFSPDGKLIASTHGDHNVYVTCTSVGKVVQTLRGHPRTPWSIAFHPSSNQILASGCLGGHVRVWDLHGGSEVWVSESLTVIASLAFHPLHRILAIASYNEIHFWDWSSDKPFAKCQTNNEKEKVRYVAFDESGSKLITGVANMGSGRRSEWDRVWPTSCPPPRPPPPPRPRPDDVDDDDSADPPLGTRITTFCYRVMLARYEQLMRRYREPRELRREPVSRGTDEVSASLSSSWAVDEGRLLVIRLAELLAHVRSAYSEAGGGDVEGATGSEAAAEGRAAERLADTLQSGLNRLRQINAQLRRLEAEAPSDRPERPPRSDERPTTDRRRASPAARLGMRLLTRHIDRISRLCRVRLDMVQLRQVRQMWDDLQRSLQELQRSVSNSAGPSGVSTSPRPPPSPSTPSTSATPVAHVTPQSATSSSGVDSEGGDSSGGSSSRRPLLSFRRSNRSSASKRMRFEYSVRSTTPGQLMRFRSWRLVSDRAGRSASSPRAGPSHATTPSGVANVVTPTDNTDDDDDDEEEEDRSYAGSSSSPAVGGSRRKRSRPVQGRGNAAGTARARSRGAGARFYRWRAAAPTAAAFAAHHQRILPRSRDQTSQTPPFLIDASVNTDDNRDFSDNNSPSQMRSAYGRLRARRALLQMIESMMMDFLENDAFSRNLPPSILHRRIICLYNLLQRALELTQNLIVQMMPASEQALHNNSGETNRETTRPRVAVRSQNSSTASPPSSSSSSGSEATVGGSSSGRIPTLRVNDGPPPEVRPRPLSHLLARPLSPPFLPYVPTAGVDSDDSSSLPIPPVYIDSSMYLRYHSMGLTHRIQAWDFSTCKLPDITHSSSNVVVNECRVHNDASVDISKDGKLLVALLPSAHGSPTSNTNMLGIYSLDWGTLGQCLYRTMCLQNAVSVSLSPTSHHLVVGLTSRRSLMSLNIPQHLAQVCRLSGGEAREEGGKLGNLLFVREIKVPVEGDTVSVNCIRWIPTPGSGFVYGTNTGQLKILR